MKKCLSLATLATLFFAASSSFLESSLKNEIKNLAEIPPVIIGIPPTRLAVSCSKQEITRNSLNLDYIKVI
jgi:hypothetical protein